MELLNSCLLQVLVATGLSGAGAPHWTAPGAVPCAWRFVRPAGRRRHMSGPTRQRQKQVHPGDQRAHLEGSRLLCLSRACNRDHQPATPTRDQTTTDLNVRTRQFCQGFKIRISEGPGKRPPFSWTRPTRSILRRLIPRCTKGRVT
jgi:hypothetical protein